MKSLETILKPKKLSHFVGQSHLVGKDGVISELLEADNIGHSFFWGPPGTGKTTLCQLIATTLGKEFHFFNATSFKIDDLRKLVSSLPSENVPIIFIDEVHRLSKNQQEVLLPFMESDVAIFFGASTENPTFSLTNAIRSRSHTFEFFALSFSELMAVFNSAQEKMPIKITDEAVEYLIYSSGGDARALLRLYSSAHSISKSEITLLSLRKIRPNALNDGTADASIHYDLASALIKSMRGTDVDAAVYYLARLIEGGEDPAFIARRLVIFASEDVGNANPPALTMAVSTLTAVSKIGYPESRIILSQCVIFLTSSPKSNSAYNAINLALSEIRNGLLMPIPNHIKPNGQGYKYPHDFGGWVSQSYLFKPLTFVNLLPIAFEKTIIEWISKIRKKS